MDSLRKCRFKEIMLHFFNLFTVNCFTNFFKKYSLSIFFEKFLNISYKPLTFHLLVSREKCNGKYHTSSFDKQNGEMTHFDCNKLSWYLIHFLSQTSYFRPYLTAFCLFVSGTVFSRANWYLWRSWICEHLERGRLHRSGKRVAV